MGEALGGGMFVFCVVQGLVAGAAVSVAPRAEYLRDCGVLALGLLVTLLCLLDGKVELYEVSNHERASA